MERALFDRIGRGYSPTRETDPRLAQLIWDAWGDAETVLNVGAAGSGTSPSDRTRGRVSGDARTRAPGPAASTPRRRGPRLARADGTHEHCVTRPCSMRISAGS
jgi:hypothetical protein